jgi:PAS domain S-box-containing protein
MGIEESDPSTVKKTLIREILATPILLGILYIAVYLWLGTGPGLVRIPWFNAVAFIFLAVTSVSIAFLAHGRFRILGGATSFWIGTGFLGFGIGISAYLLAWPGLLPGGGSVLADLPNTAAFLSVLAPGLLGICLVAAALDRWPAKRQEARWWLTAGWPAFVIILLALVLGFEQYLPELVTAQGAFTVSLKVCNAGLVLLFAAGAVLSSRRYLVSGDRILAYAALFQITLAFSSVSVMLGAQRYDLWWYLNRGVLIGGSVIVLFAFLSEYVHHLQREIAEARRLRESEERFRSLSQVTFEGIGVTDQGRIIEVNETLARMTGYSRSELLGMHGWDLMLPEYQEVARQQALSGSENPYEVVIRRKDGTTFLAEARGRAFNYMGRPARLGAITDITKRKRAEEAVRHERELLQGIINSIPVMIAIYDPHLKSFQFNKEFRRVLGWTEADAAEGDFMSKVYPDPHYRETVAAYMQSLEPGWRDFMVRAKDGSCVECSWANIQLSDQTSVGIGIDVRERKRAEEALRESEERFRTMADFSPTILWMTDAQGGLQFVNRTYRQFFGAGLEEVGGNRWQPLVHPEDAPAYAGAFQKAVRERSFFQAEARVRRADGLWRWVSSYGNPRFTSSGEYLGHVGISPDITERKEAEKELQEINRSLELRVAERTAEMEKRAEELRALAAELTRTEQRERKLLAEWLHDGLQQLLVATKIHIGLALLELKEPTARQTMEKTRRLIEESIRQSKSMTTELSPPILYESGLVGALEQLAEWMEEKHHLKVTIQTMMDVTPAEQETAVILFAAARELLFNVVKHAGVKEARVTMLNETGRLSLTVEDKGAGFDPVAVREKNKGGFGLLSVNERLRMLGGEVRVQSAPGLGTCVTLIAPASPREQTLPPDQEAV